MLAQQISQPDLRQKIIMAEAWMKEQPQVELKIINRFSYGVYSRELHIPAGVMLTGEIHKYENLNILSKGTMRVTIDDRIEEVSAPFSTISPPGTKRIAYALTDCVWTTIHGTFERNIDKIKEFFIAPSNEEWIAFCGQSHAQLELFSKGD
jgi:hypothetical protein